jgi:hypothetical protein
VVARDRPTQSGTNEPKLPAAIREWSFRYFLRRGLTRNFEKVRDRKMQGRASIQVALTVTFLRLSAVLIFSKLHRGFTKM